MARLTHSLAKTFQVRLDSVLRMVGRRGTLNAHIIHTQVTLPHPLLFPEGKSYAVIAEDADRRCVRACVFTSHRFGQSDQSIVTH